MDKEQAWDYLIHNGCVTHTELVLVTKIIGYSLETLDKVAYARCGFTSVEQLKNGDENG